MRKFENDCELQQLIQKKKKKDEEKWEDLLIDVMLGFHECETFSFLKDEEEQ